MGEQLYAIMQDSRRVGDKTILARVSPMHVTGPHDFWTDRDISKVWFLPYERALEIKKDYGWNNPRIVKEKNALAILERQKGPTQ